MQLSNGRTVMVQGRIVWTSGDLFNGKIKTVYGSNKPVLDDNGEPVKEYGFGLAVPKDVLNQTGEGQPGEVWAAIHEEANSLYPNGLPPGFAMKYKDGDGLDHNGQPFSQREGYAGHIILTCTTRLPIKWFRFENGNNIMINEGVKCGDYVNVQLQVKAHGAAGSGKPGLYLNPMAVQFLGYGQEIVNAPSGDQIFGTQAPPVPQGASQTPLAPQGGQQLVPQGQQAPAPQGLPDPNYGVLPAAHQPQQAPPQQPPPAPNGAGAPMPQTNGTAPPAPQQNMSPPPFTGNEPFPKP